MTKKLTILAKNLKFLRDRKGWAQAEIETQCGIKQRNWSNWENDISEPAVSNLIAISNLFGVTIDELLTAEIENVPITGTNVDKKEMGKSTTKSTYKSTDELHFSVNEPHTELIKKQTDLLILEQLNTLTKEVKEIRSMLDTQGN